MLLQVENYSFHGRNTNCRPYKSIQIGNLDFLLAPKCATNTIRYISYLHEGGTESVNNFRDDTYSVLRLGGTSSLPYLDNRDDALKVAVVRDPVERFISAISWYNGKYDLDVAVNDCIYSDIPDDIHFWPQTCFYGDPSQHTHIIKVDEIATLVENYVGEIELGEIHKGQHDFPRPKLSVKQTKAIKEMYTVDYENGYC